MAEIHPKEYLVFFNEVKEKIYRSQLRAMKAVNKELIELYYELGKMIMAKQETLGWGKSVVENLSNDLQEEFPGIQGFSSQNMWRMRKFYKEYKDNEKLAPLVREIGWSHNVLIF